MGSNSIRDVYLNAEITDSVNVDNGDTSIVDPTDPKYHSSLLSNYLVEDCAYFGVNDIIGLE